MTKKASKLAKVDKATPRQKVVKLSWGSTDYLETVYVNQMVINHSGPEFYITFGELAAPAFADPSEIPDELKIVPKVRLAIAQDSMVRIYEVMKENVETFLKKQGDKE